MPLPAPPCFAMTSQVARAGEALRGSGQLQVEVGLASETGPRPDNQDYAGCYLGTATERARHGVVAALADGVGGSRGGRVAAETAVRATIEGHLGGDDLLGVQRSLGEAVQAVNGWVHAQGRASEALSGMASTLTAAVLLGRQVHVAHVGDSRLYRLREGRLERLTADHVFEQPGMRNVLRRAIGAAEAVQIDYLVDALRLHDRFLLCSDGVHGPLSSAAIRTELARRSGSQDTAEALVRAALDRGGGDNATALVVDVLDLPPTRQTDLELELSRLPIVPVPDVGATVDGFRLEEVLADGRYSRVFAARDGVEERRVVMKFPKAISGGDALLRQAFLREAWIASRVRSPFVGGAVAVSAERQTRLYSVQPFLAGETLEERLKRRPRVSAEEGLSIAIQLARAVAALHRAGIIHRDIKPENVILTGAARGRRDETTVKLIDLGVARIPNVEDFVIEHAPGTPSYMAPELFAGGAGDEATDLFALGVTVYRMYAGAYPFGEIEPFARPRFGPPRPLSQSRSDLPAWLGEAIGRAVAPDPADRFGDVLEFAFSLEHGAVVAAPVSAARPSLYARNPLLFWQALCATLFVALMATLFVGRGGSGPPTHARATSGAERGASAPAAAGAR